MPNVYPIFLQLHEQPVLIVGGGQVALRKARGLVDAGARLTVRAPAIKPEFAELAGVQLERASYASEIMGRVPRWALVFAATDLTSVNGAAGRDARALGILCCRCDEPEEGNFVGGAVLQRGSVTVAVNTRRASPVLARRIRDAAGTTDPVLFQWANLLAVWRPQIIHQVRDADTRRKLLARIAGPEMEARLRDGGEKSAESLLQEWLLKTPSASSRGGGHVS